MGVQEGRKPLRERLQWQAGRMEFNLFTYSSKMAGKQRHSCFPFTVQAVGRAATEGRLPVTYVSIRMEITFGNHF